MSQARTLKKFAILVTLVFLAVVVGFLAFSLLGSTVIFPLGALDLASATIIANFWIARKSRREGRYLRYVERYEDIVSHLPYNVFFETSASVKDDQKPWLVCYIDLCHQEYRDKRDGRIKEDDWDSWVVFMVKAFSRSSALRGIFSEVEDSYPDLRDFLAGKGAIIRSAHQPRKEEKILP
jgi:hypothetical protein